MPDLIRIVEHPIDIPEILASVADDGAGGTVVFTGTTRNRSEAGPVEFLEYEAYVPMAVEVMKRIAATARSRWELSGLSAVHRIGRVPAGEASIVIAVSAAHRAGAFEACRFVIDEVKKDVPIWKKEIDGGAQRWVGP
jgi:molybdopterin synthase catalytic subunit